MILNGGIHYQTKEKVICRHDSDSDFPLIPVDMIPSIFEGCAAIKMNGWLTSIKLRMFLRVREKSPLQFICFRRKVYH